MVNLTLVEMARTFAKSLDLDEALVCAVCDWESEGWNQWAVRFEPKFYTKYEGPEDLKNATEAHLRAVSWGLMQVMGQTAREFGYPGPLPQLCSPGVGLLYGCKKLKACLEKAAGGDVRQALSFYNGGGDPTYPDHVLALYPKYQQVQVAAKVPPTDAE